MDGLLDMMTASAGGGSGLFRVTQHVSNGQKEDIPTGQNLLAGGLLWSKQTNADELGGAENHVVVDSARPSTTGNPDRPPILVPNLSNEEQPSYRNSLQPDGFRFDVGSNYSAAGAESVSFTWLAGTGYMDIVVYTGSGAASQALAHALGKKPTLGIGKSRNANGHWVVRHQGFDGIGRLNLRDEFQAGSDLALTSSAQVTVSGELNISGVTYVLYLFAEMPGQSKMGSYVGNDGNIGGGDNLVSLSFKPAAVLVKAIDLLSDWTLSYANDGASGSLLVPNKINPVAVTSDIRHSPSGFTLKTNNGNLNNLATTYIYAAFA